MEFDNGPGKIRWKGGDVKDIDGDGVKEIFYADACGNLFGIWHNGLNYEQFWSGSVSWCPRNLTVGDFDRDGACELIVGGYDGELVMMDIDNGAKTYLGDYGRDLSIALGDVTNDGNLELIVGSAEEGFRVFSYESPTCLVPDQYPTIQEAINDSNGGDTIIVSPGHYYENIDFRGKAITITSTDPCDPCTVAATIIDANGDGTVVSFHMNESINSIIIGFTITGGYSEDGAGISCLGNCSPFVSNCIIKENYATRNGGGMYIYNSAPTIYNCAFIQNDANFYGGGIYCHNSNAFISNCIINVNSARIGGGIRYTGGTPTIIDCVISGNSSLDNGGGISCDLNGNLTVRNCSFIGNSAKEYGGGIYCAGNSTLVIKNNIVCNSISGGGIYYINSDTIISYNNVWGNLDSNYGGWACPGEGDISIDPCFVYPGHWRDPCNTPEDPTDDVWIDGDYHLLCNSLCINAGDPCFVPGPYEVDMDGETRVHLGRVDMGADEAGSNPADFDESGLVDLSDFSVLAAAWLSNPENGTWNPDCDISKTPDNIVDVLDFAAFSAQWLWHSPW